MITIAHRQKLTCIIMLVFGLLLPAAGWAGEDAPDPRLTVSAEGRLTVSPDKAVLNFSVETVGEKLAKVQQENRERMAQVLKECQALGIPTRSIQTTALNIIPEYPAPPRRPSEGRLEDQIPRIIGYRVIHQVNVEVHDVEKVGMVVDRVLHVGANRFSGISWELQDEQPHKLEALKKASVKARAKAELLAQSLNVTLVRLMMVSEEAEVPELPATRYRMASLAMEGSGDSPVSAGEISILGSVTLVYEIRQK